MEEYKGFKIMKPEDKAKQFCETLNLPLDGLAYYLVLVVVLGERADTKKACARAISDAKVLSGLANLIGRKDAANICLNLDKPKGE